MSYTNGGLTEVRLAAAADLSATGDKGNWAPAFMPMEVVGVALQVGNDIGATGVIKFDKRPTFGSDTSRGDGDVGVLNLTTAHTGGKVVFQEITPIKISPGEQVVAEVTDAAAASDVGDIVIYLRPAPEVPVNLTAMVETA